MEEKYIELLLKRCINIDKSKCIFINYDIVNQDFIDKLVVRAKEYGIEEIYLDKNDIYLEHSILENIEFNDIEIHPYFDRSIWNDYAKKKFNFLIFRAPNPGVMDDIDSSKIARAEYIKRSTSSYFRKMQSMYEIPWCIAALPNIYWANKVFNNDKDSLSLLKNALYNSCMVNQDNPVKCWDNYLKSNEYMLNKLNNLRIKLLRYKNKLGTNLTLELLNDGIWCDASKNGIVNMPSYELYTTPDYRKTNGIVYSSRPLIYNGGLIENFWLRFKDGKVIEFDAEKGKDILKNIINSDSNSCYLGECALVENNSPISNTGLVFGLTLFDENASCHLALGEGFVECTRNNENLEDKQILNKGINLSKIHVDFMIGTPDLEIEAETYDGLKVKILEKGNFKK